MSDSLVESTLVDGIKSIAVHNGVVRINFMRLGMDGKDTVVLQLAIPQSQVLGLAKALTGVGR